ITLSTDSLSGVAAFTIKKIADKICIIIPTNGIHPTQEVTMPKTLPVLAPLSLLVKTKVMICNINIASNGVHAKDRIIDAPINGIPRTASNAPVIHFKIRDTDTHLTPVQKVRKLKYILSLYECKVYNIFRISG